jgi:hypothetical protein
MAALAWLVAPALADRLSGEGNLPMVKALLLCITVGLIWQFVLVVSLIWREQRTLAGRGSVMSCGSVRHAAPVAAAAAAGSG